MKTKDYRSKGEILSLMFDPLYEDFDSHGAELVLLNLEENQKGVYNRKREE